VHTSEEKIDVLVSLVLELKLQNAELQEKLDRHILGFAVFQKQLGDIHKVYFTPHVKKDKVDLKATFRNDLYSGKAKRGRSNSIN